MTIEFVQSGSFELSLQASLDGDLLVFRGAKLVRQEVNANNDDIPATELDNLARTIGGRAVDVEHDQARNCGAFTAGRVDTDEIGPVLLVDGFIWADRYPVEAQGVMAGSHRLSVEASAETAQCSVCKQTFSASDGYCEHLLARKKFGAKRTVGGLKAKGGAVTRTPAGRQTTFNRQQLYLVASHAEQENIMVKCPHCQADVEASDTCAQCAKAISPTLLAQQLNELTEKLNTATTELNTAKTELTASQARVTELEAAKTEAETAKADAETKLVKAQEDYRQHVLGLNAADWGAKKAAIMSMTAEAFALFASVSTGARTNRTVQGSVGVDETTDTGRVQIALK